MNFFAKISKLAFLPIEDVKRLFTWKQSNTVIEPTVLVAKAVDGGGKPVAYVSAEPLLIVSDYVMLPQINPLDVQKAGDALDLAIAEKAKEIGAGRFLIVLPTNVPPEPGEQWIRVIERRVQQENPITQTLDCSKQQANWSN